MPFRSLVKYALSMNSCGYWAIRQQMINNGASMQDVAHVLVFRLNMLAN